MAISIGRRQFISALGSAAFAALRLSFVLPVVLLLAGVGPALPQQAQIPAQDPDTLDPTPPGSLNPEPLPPLENPNSPKTPAKQLFARKLTPSPVRRARSAATPTVASLAPRRCRSTARPGK